MARLDSDLHLGQIAIRMGLIGPQDLPDLIREARGGTSPAVEGSRSIALGQVLLRRRLINVSDYLLLARRTREESEAAPTSDLIQIQQAYSRFESGDLDNGSLETLLSRSAEVSPLQRTPLERFGAYELLGEVARGGMGIVYRARDPQGRIVALKVMIEADDDEVRLKRFENEAELAAALDHPHIVRVYDAGRIDGIPYFTMDLIDGESLEDKFEKGTVVRDEAIQALAQCARAADHAHERGIVHRDLKPGNILLDHAGDAHVTDFGLARDLARMTRLTQVGQAVGTPYYMAPEQVRGERDVDGRADIYALGVILYEVLTGDVPFDAPSPLSLFKKIDREPIELSVDEAAGVDPDIHAIVHRALAKERAERYSRGNLLAEDLERYLAGRPVRAQPGPGLGAGLGDARLTLLAAVLTPLAAVTVAAAIFVSWRSAAARRDREQGQSLVSQALERSRAAAEQIEAALEGDQPGQARSLLGEAKGELDGARQAMAQDDNLGRGAREAWGSAQGDQLTGTWRALTARTWSALARQQPDLQGPPALEVLERLAAEADRPGPSGAAVWRSLAEVQALLGEEAKARQALAQALERDAQDWRARLILAELQLGLAQPEAAGQAFEELGRLAAERPDDVRVLLARAQAARTLGRHDSAREDAELAASLATSADVRPLVFLGELELRRGQPELALRQARAASSRDPDSRWAKVLEARALSALGRLSEALERLDSAAEGATDPLLKSHVELARARCALRALDYEGARRALAAAGRGVPSVGLRAGERLVLLGQLSLLTEGPSEALPLFQQARQAAPCAALPRAWLLRVLIRSVRADQLEAQVAAALAGLPEELLAGDPELLSARGEAALALGDHQEARQHARQALGRAGSRGHPAARTVLARARVAERGAADPAARATADQAWAAAAGDGDLAAVYLARGLELAALGLAYQDAQLEREQAARWVEASQRLAPWRARAMLVRGELFAALQPDLPGLAFGVWQEANELDPTQPAPAERLARLALRLADDPEWRQRANLARSALEAVLASEGGPVAQRLLLARLCAATGNVERALEVLATASRPLPTLAVTRARVELLEAAGRDAAEQRQLLAELEAKATKERRLLSASESPGVGELAALRGILAANAAGPHRSPDEKDRALGLTLARRVPDPLERLASLSVLLWRPGRAGLLGMDELLGAEWTQPLSPARRETLLRLELPERALTVGLAAMYDRLADGKQVDPAWLSSAARQAQAALAAAPGSLAAWLARGYLRVHAGFPQQGVQDLEAVTRLLPDLALGWFALAEGQRVLGEASKSQRALERARELNLIRLEERLASSPFLSQGTE